VTKEDVDGLQSERDLLQDQVKRMEEEIESMRIAAVEGGLSKGLRDEVENANELIEALQRDLADHEVNFESRRADMLIMKQDLELKN
jgi:hypothetical protein